MMPAVKPTAPQTKAQTKTRRVKPGLLLPVIRHAAEAVSPSARAESATRNQAKPMGGKMMDRIRPAKTYAKKQTRTVIMTRVDRLTTKAAGTEGGYLREYSGKNVG